MKYRSNISRIVLFAVAVFQLLFVSCKDEVDWLIGTPIKVVATTDGSTRSVNAANTNIQTSTFDENTTLNAYYKITDGDVIGKTPITLTASAPVDGKNVLTPDLQTYYPSPGTVDIMALYPQTDDEETNVTNDRTSFTVQADQSSDENYKLSDLMWAGVTSQGKTPNDVNLVFKHKMAKMMLDVTSKEGVLIQSVSLINVQRTINFAAPSAAGLTLGAIGTETVAANKTILVGSASDGGTTHISGAALFPPQPIAANFIEVVTNFGTAIYSTNKTFEEGKVYTVELTVMRQQIGTVTTIADWTANGHSIVLPPSSNAVLTIEPIDPVEYDGDPQEPNLTIWYAPNDGPRVQLTKDTDYSVEFFNNLNIGTATVIITGLKTSPKSVVQDLRALTSFEITAATGDISYEESAKTVDYVYYGTVSNTLITNGGDGKFTYESSNVNVATVSRETGVVTIKGTGYTDITASMDASGNYTADNATYRLTVNPRKISSAVAAGEIVITPSVSSVPYTGQAYMPAVTVTDQGRTLQKGVHYTATYTNNTNHGTATITINGVEKENGVYDWSGTYKATATFEIQAVATGLAIDQSAVTLPVDFSLTRKGTTDFGTIKYSSSNNNIATVGQSSGIVTGVAPGTATITATVTKDASENYPTTSLTYDVTVVNSKWTYNYTGTVQSWQCPLTGVYKLEAFGAQGGTCGGFNGGRGAYVSGQLTVQEGQILYIYVGGRGLAVTNYTEPQGGWNGGGKFTTPAYTSTTDTRLQHNFCGGGGATDFALQGTNESTDWNNSNHLNSRILVAGGGGGALYREWASSTYKFTGGGGGGGAYNGETGYGGSKPGGGGTLSGGGTAGSADATAGSFGIGGNYSGTENSDPESAYLSAGMGGGGWYGGGSGGTDPANENPKRLNSEGKSDPLFSRQGSGGGGSSYIWNATNASYYNGHGSNNAPITTGSVVTDPTKFYITPTGMTEGVRGGADDLGHGMAVITYMGAEE